MVDVQTTSVAITAISVVAFVINSILTSRREEKRSQQNLVIRQTQFFMQLYQQLNSEESHRRWIDALNWKWSDLDDFERKYGSDEHSDMYAKRQSSLYELNGVGYLLRKGVIDRDTAYSLTGGITRLWIWKFEPILKEQRARAF